MKLNPIASNQTELTLDDGSIFFFSYKTLVAAKIDKDWWTTTTKHSRTTSKHINTYLSSNGVSATKPLDQRTMDTLLRGMMVLNPCPQL